MRGDHRMRKLSVASPSCGRISYRPTGGPGDGRSASPRTEGHSLTFGGETRDGNFVRIEDLRGKPVLIVFRVSHSESFQETVQRLKRVLQPYGKSTLNVLGVCLDESDKTLDKFAEKNRPNCTQVFAPTRPDGLGASARAVLGRPRHPVAAARECPGSGGRHARHARDARLPVEVSARVGRQHNT